MTWDELVELVKSKPREEAFAAIDALVALRPELADAAEVAKVFLDQFYNTVAAGEIVVAGVAEIWASLKAGKGPVSKAPEIGLV